jgi:hypothetical protein
MRAVAGDAAALVETTPTLEPTSVNRTARAAGITTRAGIWLLLNNRL